MIKLAIISDDPGRGGAFKVAQDIAMGLPKDIFEYQFIFLCDAPIDYKAPEGIYIGAPQYEFDFSLWSYMQLAFFPNKSQCNYEPLQKAITAYEPDIIHAHTHPITLPIIKELNKYVNKQFKLFYTDHLQRIKKKNNVYLFKDRILAKVYANLFKDITTIFISNLAHKTAQDLGFAHKGINQIILNSVDTALFYPKKDKIDLKFQVVYLARFISIKGHDTLLDTWSRLPFIEGLELLLYGVVADGGHIQRRIENEAFPNPVYYKGVTDNPAEILREASMGVFPSFREGMPLALLEMMATGLPIVASDIPEIATLITDNEDLMLFKCGDADDLAKKIILLINDASLRNKLGNNAREKVLRQYSKPLWESYSELYINCLK